MRKDDLPSCHPRPRSGLQRLWGSPLPRREQPWLLAPALPVLSLTKGQEGFGEVEASGLCILPFLSFRVQRGIFYPKTVRVNYEILR